MAAINLCLNGLQGEVAWMDSLGGEHWGGYSVSYLYGCIPAITKVSANEGMIYNSEPFHKKTEDQPAKATIIKVSQGKLDL